jgi:hypothetical protein
MQMAGQAANQALSQAPSAQALSVQGPNAQLRQAVLVRMAADRSCAKL